MTQTPARKGWFARNWKWVVPLGCLTPILLCGGIVALVVGVLFGAIKSSDPYTQGLQAAQGNTAVVSRLGTPVLAGMLVTGSIHIEGSAGNADIAIPISGPKGKGTLYIVGQKSGGKWSYSTMRVDVEGSGEAIDLTKSGPE